MKLRYVIILIVIGIASAAGYMYLQQEKPVAVTVVAVERGTVSATVANTRAGTVKARQRARLAPAVGGQIAELSVQKGDVVKADQVLLTIWNKDLQAQLALVEAEAEAAKRVVDEACLQAEFAERDAKRISELRLKKSASASAEDKARTTAATARLACDRAGIQAEVAAERVATIRAQLDKTILRAPFAGIVAEVNGEVGEFITPSPTGVATLPAVDLIDLDELYVTAPIDEMDAARIRPEMLVHITLDAYGDTVFPGKVLRVAPYVLEEAKQARTVEVECAFEDSAQTVNLLAGYSADVEIILDKHASVLRIPAESLLEDSTVYVFAGEGLSRKKVKTALANWRYVEISSGLKEGEKVVTSVGREGLGDGVAAVLEPEEK